MRTKIARPVETSMKRKANSVDPDEEAHDEPPRRDLHFLKLNSFHCWRTESKGYVPDAEITFIGNGIYLQLEK